MRDFSLEMYDALCAALRDAGYVALPVGGYLQRAGEGLPERVVLLRHDVESRPAHAVAMARRERDRGRWRPTSFARRGAASMPRPSVPWPPSATRPATTTRA